MRIEFEADVLHTKPKMLQNLGIYTMAASSPMLPFYANNNRIPCSCNIIAGFWCTYKALNLSNQQFPSFSCPAARRWIRYEEEDENGDDEEYGHNEQIAKLELYSQSASGEALLVHALVDEEEVDVLIFKGFSSSLSYSTSPDPTRSILPTRAVIKSIDRIKGPFDPSNIEYLEKGLTWEVFNTNFLPS